jgi:hypothetical protein
MGWFEFKNKINTTYGTGYVYGDKYKNDKYITFMSFVYETGQYISHLYVYYEANKEANELCAILYNNIRAFHVALIELQLEKGHYISKSDNEYIEQMNVIRINDDIKENNDTVDNERIIVELSDDDSSEDSISVNSEDSISVNSEEVKKVPTLTITKSVSMLSLQESSKKEADEWQPAKRKHSGNKHQTIPILKFKEIGALIKIEDVPWTENTKPPNFDKIKNLSFHSYKETKAIYYSEKEKDGKPIHYILCNDNGKQLLYVEDKKYNIIKARDKNGKDLHWRWQRLRGNKK